MKKFQVAPFDQHLTCNGRDLNDNQATLASLRIYPGTVIILKVSCRTVVASPSRVVIVFVELTPDREKERAGRQTMSRAWAAVRDESMARIRRKSSRQAGTHRPTLLFWSSDSTRAKNSQNF